MSVNAAGTGTGDDPSSGVRLSDDGRYAAFLSFASDLVPSGQDGNAISDVYRRDLTTGTTQLVSAVEGGGSAGNGVSEDPQISPDGRYVSYQSSATDLLAGPVDDNGSTTDVYRHDSQVGANRLISVSFDRTAAATGLSHAVLATGAVGFISVGVTIVPPGQDTGTGSDDFDVFLTRNASPGVAFTAAPDSGAAPLTIAFEGSASDEGPVAYEWEFGDGATATGPSVVHAYLVPGTYTARLTARDREDGTASTTREIVVTAPSGPPPPGGLPTDPVPVVTAFSAAPRRFALVRGARPAARSPRGTTFRFTLSEAARTRIAIQRARPGRRSGRRCVKPTRRLRARRRCTRYTAIGALTQSSALGANQLRFTGRIGARSLRRGRHRATIVATDSAGQRSVARRARFRVVRR